jgi:hypothetical protein
MRPDLGGASKRVPNATIEGAGNCGDGDDERQQILTVQLWEEDFGVSVELGNE